MQLVINTFGASLRKDGERFCVKAGDKQFAVSAHKVRSILISTAAHLSTDAIQLASENNIDLVFLDKYGEPYARVWQPKVGSTAAIRRRQLEVAENDVGLGIVLEWTKTKIRHQAELLDQLWRRRDDADDVFAAACRSIQETLAKLEDLTGSLDEIRNTIMGLEGSAGRAYFQCLGKLMPEAFRFSQRSRHPAKDEFNCMLNYAYGVLYSHVERACIVAGLDPFIGFLHTDNYNKRSLVFDMIEPFRIVAERTTVFLFTGRKVRKDMCDEIPGGMTLNSDGKALLITALNDRLEKTVRYPVKTGSKRTRNLKQRDIIQTEAHSLANRLLGREDMPRIVETREMWGEE